MVDHVERELDKYDNIKEYSKMELVLVEKDRFKAGSKSYSVANSWDSVMTVSKVTIQASAIQKKYIFSGLV